MKSAYEYLEEEKAIIRKGIEAYLTTGRIQKIELGDVETYFGVQDAYEVLNYVEGDDQTYKFDWNYVTVAVVHIEKRVQIERLRRANLKRLIESQKNDAGRK